MRLKYRFIYDDDGDPMPEGSKVLVNGKFIGIIHFDDKTSGIAQEEKLLEKHAQSKRSVVQFISDRSPRQNKQARRSLRSMRPKLIIRPVKDEQPNLTEHEATSLREMILSRARERGITVQQEDESSDNHELTGRAVEREEPRLTEEETQGLMNLIEREALAMGIRVKRNGKILEPSKGVSPKPSGKRD